MVVSVKIPASIAKFFIQVELPTLYIGHHDIPCFLVIVCKILNNKFIHTKHQNILLICHVLIIVLILTYQ